MLNWKINDLYIYNDSDCVFFHVIDIHADYAVCLTVMNLKSGVFAEKIHVFYDSLFQKHSKLFSRCDINND